MQEHHHISFLTPVLLNKLIFSQADHLILIVAINSHTWWQTVQIQISWLLRSQLIWIYTVCKDRVYEGSAGQGLSLALGVNLKKTSKKGPYMAQIIPIPFKMLSAEIFIQSVEHYKKVSMLFVLFCLWVMADQIDLSLWPSNCNMHKFKNTFIVYTGIACKRWAKIVSHGLGKFLNVKPKLYSGPILIRACFTCSSGGILALFLLDLDMPCLCKQCRSRLVNFWRRQLIWMLLCGFLMLPGTQGT